MVHDRDAIFSMRVRDVLASFGTKSLPTAPRSPWQNGIAERWIGSCRRELLDHVIVLSEEHLRRLLAQYVRYYNEDRVHTRTRDAPQGRPVDRRPGKRAEAVALPRVGGLQHRYAWAEAA